jgi:amino acid transporter
LKRTVLTYGFICGAIIVVTMAITMSFHDQIGFDTTGLVVGYATIVLAFLMIFLGIKSYRDNVAGGAIKFAKAFQVGILITAIGCAFYVASWEVIYHNFMPDFTDKYAAHEMAKAKESGATEAQLAAKAKEMADFKEMYKNPLMNVALTLLEPLPVGLLITLVAAGVLSRKKSGGALA